MLRKHLCLTAAAAVALLPLGCNRQSTTEPPVEETSPTTNTAPESITNLITNLPPVIASDEVSNTKSNVVESAPPETNSPPVAVPASTKYPGQDLYESGLTHLQSTEDTAADLDTAVELFQQAADLGNPAGEHALGVCYLNGIGVARDTDEAFKWLSKSAEKGFPDAQFKLASLYARGIGVTQDVEAAAVWARRAADRGHPEAQYNLATLYSAGTGVPHDMILATEWFKKAAQNGHPIAQSNLGVLYANGKVVEKDMAEAIKWFRKAAEQGQRTAQYNLAQAYHEGKHIPKDLAEAYKWYSLAAEQGDRDAQAIKDAIAVDLAPADVAEALREARLFRTELQARRTSPLQ